MRAFKQPKIRYSGNGRLLFRNRPHLMMGPVKNDQTDGLITLAVPSQLTRVM